MIIPRNSGPAAMDLTTRPGRGKMVAETFQKALFVNQDGYDGRSTIAEIGLRSVAQTPGASEREISVAQFALRQAEMMAQTGTTRKSEDAASRAIAQSEALAYLASGGVASGPIGAVLCDLACRQMDKIRTQACHTASGADIRDSNLAGYAMLQQISEQSSDPRLSELAQQTLQKVQTNYGRSESEGAANRQFDRFLKDSEVIYDALEEIKVVAVGGEPNNPKCLAFLDGQSPDGHFPLSLGRPGGKSAYYPDSGVGFGVIRPTPDSR